jgi:hypothetical protein
MLQALPTSKQADIQWRVVGRMRIKTRRRYDDADYTCNIKAPYIHVKIEKDKRKHDGMSRM